MGYVLKGADSLLVFDGGSGAETELLETLILGNGGVVDAWFLSHAHSDHIHAVYGVLQRRKVTARAFYFAFPPLDFIKNCPSMRMSPRRVDCVTGLTDFIAQSGISHIAPQKGIEIKVGGFGVLPLSDGRILTDDLNATSVVYRVKTRGKSILFLGDMDPAGEDALLSDFPEEVKCPIVQMAHHGQGALSERFYSFVHPEICLWPTPRWLWENDSGAGTGSGPWETLHTRAWMKKLGATDVLSLTPGVPARLE
jgi:beta-lactamase superfamily II metal-dependent hydrolase